MPGSIRVSVLEAMDLPTALTDGMAVKDVTVKVMLGQREYKTEPGNADGGRTAPWNSDFAFPVTNLRDKLVVAVCNNEDQPVTQTAIEIPSIIEKGFRDEFVEFKGGGRIHLKMSFVLTDEERRKIETMRVAALKRREEERRKKTVVFKTLQPAVNEPPVSKVTITEVDESTMDGGNEHPSKGNTASAPLGFGPTAKPLKPKPLFDYARAVGVKGRPIKRKPKRRPTTPGASSPLSKIVKTDSGEIHPAGHGGGESPKDLREDGSSGSTRPDASSGCALDSDPPGGAATPGAEERAGPASEKGRDLRATLGSRGQPPPSPATPIQKDASTAGVPPSMQGPYIGRITPGNVKARIKSLQGLEETTTPAAELLEDQWLVEGQRARDMLEAEAAAMAVSLEESSSLEDEQRGKRRVNKGAALAASKEQMRRLGGGEQGLLKAQRELETDSRTPISRVNPGEERQAPSKSPGQPISVSELHQLASSEAQEEAMKQLDSQDGLPNKVWQALSAVADEILSKPGIPHRPEARRGPGARWAQKTMLESRWASPAASPEKARRGVRDDCYGQVSDPFRARAKILELVKAAAGSHESYGDDRGFQEHHSLAGSIGVVVNKVVGGAAMLLAALFMLWPLGEGPPERRDGAIEDDRFFPAKFGENVSSNAPLQFRDHHFKTLKANIQGTDTDQMYPGHRLL